MTLFLLTLIPLLLPSLASTTAEPIDSAAAMKRAQELHPFVSSGTPGPLWAAFDEKMRTAMGDSTRFAALEGIHAQMGAI
jgi:hypothetical protein